MSKNRIELLPKLLTLYSLYCHIFILSRSIYLSIQSYLPIILRAMFDLTGLEMLLLVATHPRSAPAQALGRQFDSSLATTNEGGVTDIVVETIVVSGRPGQGEFEKEVNVASDWLIVQYTCGTGSPGYKELEYLWSWLFHSQLEFHKKELLFLKYVR